MPEQAPRTKTAARAHEKRPARTPKTRAGADSVEAFLAGIEAKARSDCEKLDAWMRAATGCPGVMYGKSIVGYGSTTIRYADGREAPWMKMGFSPRAQALTLYGVIGSAAAPALLERLGKHTTGKDCLYVKRLCDVHEDILRDLLEAAAE